MKENENRCIRVDRGKIISVYTDRPIDFEPVFFTDGRVRLMELTGRLRRGVCGDRSRY